MDFSSRDTQGVMEETVNTPYQADEGKEGGRIHFSYYNAQILVEANESEAFCLEARGGRVEIQHLTETERVKVFDST